MVRPGHDYTLSEGPTASATETPKGYELDRIEQWVPGSEGGDGAWQAKCQTTGTTKCSTLVDISVDANDHDYYRFVNRQIPGEVEWEKVDESDPANHLAGSEWQLTGPAGFVAMGLSQASCGGPEDPPTNDPYCTHTATGKFSVNNLPWGHYELTETKAPAGYVKSDCVYQFTVDAEHLSVDTLTVKSGENCEPKDGNQIPNKQAEGPSLPLTGGASAFGFFVAALVLGGIAGTVETVRRKKRRA